MINRSASRIVYRKTETLADVVDRGTGGICTTETDDRTSNVVESEESFRSSCDGDEPSKSGTTDVGQQRMFSADARTSDDCLESPRPVEVETVRRNVDRLGSKRVSTGQIVVDETDRCPAVGHCCSGQVPPGSHVTCDVESSRWHHAVQPSRRRLVADIPVFVFVGGGSEFCTRWSPLRLPVCTPNGVVSATMSPSWFAMSRDGVGELSERFEDRKREALHDLYTSRLFVLSYLDCRHVVSGNHDDFRPQWPFRGAMSCNSITVDQICPALAVADGRPYRHSAVSSQLCADTVSVPFADSRLSGIRAQEYYRSVALRRAVTDNNSVGLFCR